MHAVASADFLRFICSVFLSQYITLSGGTTMFKNFTKRLERDIARKVKERFDFQVSPVTRFLQFAFKPLA